MESAQIVNSLSDDGKAAYMLRKTANDGMSAYNEIYGYYQMVKALDMSTKGKVKTGSKSNSENLDYRKKPVVEVNPVGETIATRKEIKNYKTYWGRCGIKVKIDKDGILPERMAAGFDYKDGIIYVREKPSNISMAHEGYHTKQWLKLGKEEYLKLTRLQREELVYEQIMKNQYRFDKASIDNAKIYIDRLRLELGE
jgi:hypothetical protein